MSHQRWRAGSCACVRDACGRPVAHASLAGAVLAQNSSKHLPTWFVTPTLFLLVLVDLLLACLINAGFYKLHHTYFLVLLFVLPLAWLMAPVVGTLCTAGVFAAWCRVLRGTGLHVANLAWTPHAHARPPCVPAPASSQDLRA